MSTDLLDISLTQEINQLKEEGRAKPAERIITGYVPPKGDQGPRYRLAGNDKEFIRMNSNSYLSLSNHPDSAPAIASFWGRAAVNPPCWYRP